MYETISNRSQASASPTWAQASSGEVASAVTDTAGAPSGWRRARRLMLRIAGGAALSLAAIAGAGAAYEAIAGAGDAAAYPPNGQLVDVGGYRLHLDCRGEGSPTIVMDAGLGGSSLDWALVQPELAKGTRVCVYDRAGMGWSDAGTLPRSPAHIAEELHLLLQAAGVQPPYILVAHSLAGKNARMFAMAHPDEVAGMVLVDARSERVDMGASAAESDGLTMAFKAQATAFSIGRRFGAARLFGASLLGQPLVPPALAGEMVLLETQPAAIVETVQEGAARATDDDVLAQTNLGAIPLVVIAAEQNMLGLDGWASAQNGLAHLSTSGQLLIAKGSGHYVQLEHPDLVIGAVQQVIAATRARP